MTAALLRRAAPAACTTRFAGALAGPRVVAQVRDHDEPKTKNFLEILHAA